MCVKLLGKKSISLRNICINIWNDLNFDVKNIKAKDKAIYFIAGCY